MGGNRKTMGRIARFEFGPRLHFTSTENKKTMIFSPWFPFIHSRKLIQKWQLKAEVFVRGRPSSQILKGTSHSIHFLNQSSGHFCFIDSDGAFEMSVQGSSLWRVKCNIGG
jgi:hypothetical protein